MSRSNIVSSWSDILIPSSPLICGILNVTPDSFSDGGQYLSRDASENKINNLISDGAGMIDVGAESTRPGAQEVPSEEEILRLTHIFNVLTEKSFSEIFSIDTRHHHTAQVAMENGFNVINDVSGGLFDSKMNSVIAKTDALCILMHMRGMPETMMDLSTYGDIVDDVTRELEVRVHAATNEGVNREKIMIDPGIGFAKTPQDNAILIKNCMAIKDRIGLPIMMGVSRKSVTSFLLSGASGDASMSDRDAKTAELSSYFAECGVDAIRVHAVAKTVQAVTAGKQ